VRSISDCRRFVGFEAGKLLLDVAEFSVPLIIIIVKFLLSVADLFVQPPKAAARSLVSNR